MMQNDENVNTESRVETIQHKPAKIKMILLCLVATEVFLIGIIVFLLYYTQPPSENKVCDYPECFHTSAHIMDSIDIEKNPCENFYDFACGKMSIQKEKRIDIFAPKHLLGKDKPQFLKKFRRYYESCVSHDDKFDFKARVENAKSLIERIGSIRFSNKGNEDFNLTNFVADLILSDSMPLFDVKIDVDPDDSTYILKLMLPDQTSLDLGHWSTLSETKRKCLRETENTSYGREVNTTYLYNAFLLCQKNYADYLDSISTSMQELDFFKNLTEKDTFGQVRDIRLFIEFEILSKFDEIPLPPNLQEINMKHKFEKVKVSFLESQFPQIRWQSLFKRLTNKSISSESKIQLYNLNYFYDVFREITSEKHRPLNNAFLAMLGNSLFENTVLPIHRHSREDFCKDQSRKLMPDIVNYLYKVIAKPKMVQRKNGIIRSMYQSLSRIFVNSLEEQSWLDEASKASIIKKLKSIELVLFDKENIESEKVELEKAYQSLDIMKGEYQLNQFGLIEFRRKRIFSLHGENVTAENMYRHFVDPLKEEPVFFYSNNIVSIPFGLYKHVKEELPQYLIDSRVGFLLARIIGNAFDSIGMHYGVNLTEKAKKLYKEFARETKDMILDINPIDFDGKILFFNLNNDLSENERIADNTAMKLITEKLRTFQAYEALPLTRPMFNKQKQFFLHLVQGICQQMKVTDFMVNAYENSILPPQLRVESFLGNSKMFLESYNCQPSSVMARFNRSLQFPYL